MAITPPLSMPRKKKNKNHNFHHYVDTICYRQIRIHGGDFLVNIILYGDKGDNQIRNLIIDDLARCESIYLYSEKFIKQIGDKASLLIFDTASIAEIELSECIIVFKENARLSSIKKMPPNAIAVVSSANTELIEQLSAHRISLISCGMLAKDTLTFSSSMYENMVVALQREMETPSGKIYEPLEIPVSYNVNANKYAVLAYMAIKLLTENIK